MTYFLKTSNVGVVLPGHTIANNKIIYHIFENETYTSWIVLVLQKKNVQSFIDIAQDVLIY